jgi:DNA anti-recombination protein RmuC
VKHELESLSSRLKNEHEQRVAAIKDAAQDLKELKQALQQRASQLDEQIATGQREARQQLLDQYRNLSEEIRQKAEESANALQREAGELRFEKADRAALAALFHEVALRLKDEFKIPGAEHLKND